MTNEYLNNRTFEKIIKKFQKSKKQQVRYQLIIEDFQDTLTRKRERDSHTQEDRDLLKESKANLSMAEQDHDDSKQELAAAFYTLSENIVRYAKFQLIDEDDAIQEGVMICFEKIDRFDPRKGKAFNYMTTCILNHFRQLYRTARNYNELKKKYLNHLQVVLSRTIIKNGKEIVNWSSHS